MTETTRRADRVTADIEGLVVQHRRALDRLKDDGVDVDSIARNLGFDLDNLIFPESVDDQKYLAFQMNRALELATRVRAGESMAVIGLEQGSVADEFPVVIFPDAAAAPDPAVVVVATDAEPPPPPLGLERDVAELVHADAELIAVSGIHPHTQERVPGTLRVPLDLARLTRALQRHDAAMLRIRESLTAATGSTAAVATLPGPMRDYLRHKLDNPLPPAWWWEEQVSNTGGGRDA